MADGSKKAEAKLADEVESRQWSREELTRTDKVASCVPRSVAAGAIFSNPSWRALEEVVPRGGPEIRRNTPTMSHRGSAAARSSPARMEAASSAQGGGGGRGVAEEEGRL